MYKQQLLAFVQKNLLGGAYLPNLTNKDQILKSVVKVIILKNASVLIIILIANSIQNTIKT